jgi:hypothetical protein
MTQSRATSTTAPSSGTWRGHEVERLRALYRRRRNNAAVLCFGDVGPLRLSASALDEARAGRRDGIRYLFAAYDVHAGRLHAHLGPAHSSAEALWLLRHVRALYPPECRIHWVQGELPSFWTPEIRSYAATHRISLVSRPPGVSSLDRLTGHLHRLAARVFEGGVAYLDWRALEHALARQVRRQNALARARSSAEAGPGGRTRRRAPMRQPRA